MKFQKLITLIFLVFGFNISFSQTFQLKSSNFNNGFGTATSGSFQLNGAVGEISSGPSSSTSFVLNTGSISNRVASAIDPGLIAHYPFNGNLDDISGNLYAASYNGTQNYDTDVAGLEGRSFDFDGATRVAHTLAEPMNFTGFTVSVWVYLDNPFSASSQHIIGLESPGRLFQIVSYNGFFGFWEGDSDGLGLGYVEIGATTEGWNHLAVTWDGTVVTGYLNGEEAGNGDAPEALNFSVSEFSFGDNVHYDEFLEGDIDEAKVFNYPLASADIQYLYESYPPLPTAPQNLVAKIVGPGSVQLTWEDGPDETYYYVYWDDQAVEPESGYVELAQNETTYTITGLTPGTEYYIEVDAGNDVNYNYTVTYQTPVDQGTTQAAPDYFTLDETVTIQYYNTLSYPDTEMDTVSSVFMHAGLIAPEDVESGEWSDTLVVEMNNNLGVWEATINPRSDFGVSSIFIAEQLGLFFTNADSSAYGYAADLENIKLQIFDPTNIAPIAGFLQTDANTDVYIDDGTTLTPDSVQLAEMSEYTMEALVNFGDANPANGSFADLITRGFDDGANYFPYHGAIYYTYDEITAYPTAMSSINIGGGTIEHYLYGPASGIDASGQGVAYANGSWAHVAMVYTTPSMGNIDLYINGIYQGAVSVEGVPEPGNMLRIGQFVGGVDELRIWNDVRTQEQIRTNIKAEIDPASEGLIGYWKMNEKTDISGTEYIFDETDSFNDFIVGNGSITQLSDLDLISFALNPKSIAQEETLSISFTVENIGDADAGAFDLEFFLSEDNVFDESDVALTDANVNFSSGLTMGESVFNIVTATIPSATGDNNYFVIAVIDDPNVVNEGNETNNTATAALNVNAANVNNVTTSITLDNYTFEENAAVGTWVGAIFYDDPDDDLFDISLVGGTGDTHNDLFQIVGGELLTNSIRDFEIDATTYSVRIQVDDNRGGVYSEAISITLTDINESPTDIILGPSTIAAGTNYFEQSVGTLETIDQDNGDSHWYLITAENNPDASFLISGSELLITVNDPVVDEEFYITIQSTDSEGLTISKELVVTVIPAGLAPNALLLTNNTINENHGAGAVIGQFLAVDSDSDTHTYALVSGGTDNAEFSVSSAGELTQNNENLGEGNYSIRVSATDDTDLSITRTFSIEVIDNDVDNVISIGGSISNYRIISVPFTNSTVTNTFPDLTNENNFTDWRMFGYNNGNLSEIKTVSTRLSQVNGYWFITTIPQEIELPAGTINTNATIQKSLSEGWNLIGNPYLKTLNWDNILEFNGNPSSVGTDVHIWNGGWTTTSNLGVMQGGFIEVNGTPPTTFEFYPSTASIGTARVAASSRTFKSYFDNTDAWQLFLNLESNGMTSNISGVGLNEIAADEKDMLDKSAPPTPASFDPLQLTEKATGLTKNIKAVNASVFWDFALTGTQESTTITWDQNVASQLDEPLILALLPQGDLYDMTTVGELTFKPEKNQSVMVVYGDELPKELLYNAITAYPNPVDREVSFRFYVDSEGFVPAAIELFDVTGQRLGSIDQMVNGGQWNEINYKVGTQELLKSGIYLFKVKYADFESAVKRLIVK